jgi:hypothetical protein
MASAVRYLLDSPAEAARMAKAARSRIGARYGVPALCAALATAYCPDADRASDDWCEPPVGRLEDAT